MYTKTNEQALISCTDSQIEKNWRSSAPKPPSHSSFVISYLENNQLYLRDAQTRMAKSHEAISRSELLIGRLERLGQLLDRIVQRQQN